MQTIKKQKTHRTIEQQPYNKENLNANNPEDKAASIEMIRRIYVGHMKIAFLNVASINHSKITVL